ncbi:MAG: DUF2723 domain-containing protein [Tannerella sp.]|jgi:hypothetical protein|nr:DUF2723 domain-containing protein [Tannerella sp.]
MKRYRLVNNVLGWLLFVIAAFTYLSTMESSASLWDCGEFILSAYKLEVGHPPGAPFFMLTGNLFTRLASEPAMVPVMVNAMSSLFSALTILFLFWSVTHLARRIVVQDEKKEMTLAQLITIMGCGAVGALVYTFSDTFWFSAVEGEVYAFSSLFTAVVFWLILKWEDMADQPHADRWIVLIAYLMGLSIGVHLLNLLCIPAIILVYYYKKFPNPTTKGTLMAIAVSFVVIVVMMYGVVQGLVEVCGLFELLFVNMLGMPYNSGVYVYVFMIAIVLGWAIWETMREEIHETRMKIAFILSVVLTGIPFFGDGYYIGILIVAAMVTGLFFTKAVMRKINVRMLNTTLISLFVIVIGYSTYALILIRATADTPMNQNSPSDIFTLRTYLAREQYGATPLIYGQTYVSEYKYESDGKGGWNAAIKNGSPVWRRILKENPDDKDRYFISSYNPKPQFVEETMMLFPRLYSNDPRHIDAYKSWVNIKGETVRFNYPGEIKSVVKPTFAENLHFFFQYQLNWMYWRYFLWNFSGRQNDIQGNGGILNGNAITGIKFIDEFWLGSQDNLPYDIVNNKGHNKFYMLPLLLGLLGIVFQVFNGRKGIQSFWITFFLFFMTGIAIVLYLNQTPYQPRERDYAYAGSFYAYCIWVGLGVAILVRWLTQYLKTPETTAAILASVLCLLVPIQMVSQTWDDHDRSGRTVARDFGSNYLESCDENAIIFTNGDNDTFPLWYAQEVEGIRTDVRVCNTSYLQTDWYTDQMKRQAYNSDPLPITWTKAEYMQGTRDMVYIINRMPQGVDLGTALTFLRSNDPSTKRIPNSTYPRNLDHFPSEKLLFAVDSAAVMRYNAISLADTSRLLKEMVIDLSGRTFIPKEAVTILDMLHTNNWKRPIYYAATVDPSQYVNLDKFFQRTGLAFRITPVLGGRDLDSGEGRRTIDTEKMYDNLMNKFKWGGVDRPGVYLDEQVMNMCKSYRHLLFGDLALALMNEGQTEKAVTVLDRAMQVLPGENIPLDRTALILANAYLTAGEIEKGEQILNSVADFYMRSIRWVYSLRPELMSTVMSELQEYLYHIQYIIQIGTANNPEFGQSFRDEFFTYRMMFLNRTQPANQ